MEEPRPAAPASLLDKMFEQKVVERPATEAAEKKKMSMPRELYNLIGDRVPIAPSNGYSSEKARLGANKPATRWCFVPFVNPARQDGLRLSHWVKESEQEKEYAFAKFNMGLQVMSFTDDEYAKHLADDMWSLAETRLLFDLCQEYDVRFPVVWDRFMTALGPSAPQRDVEALKIRYYGVVNKLAAARGMPESCVERAFVYDAEHESRRKKQLEMLMNRTPAQVHEEEMLKQELRRLTQQKKETGIRPVIESKRKASRPRAAFKTPVGAAATATTATSTAPPSTPTYPSTATRLALVDTAPSLQGRAALSPPLPADVHMATAAAAPPVGKGVQLRSAVVHRPLNVTPPQADMLERHLGQLGVAPRPLPTERVAGLYQEIRENIIALINLEGLVERRHDQLRTLGLEKSRAAEGQAIKRRHMEPDGDGADRKAKRPV